MNELILELVRVLEQIAGDPGKTLRVAVILALLVALAAVLRP